VNRITAPLHTPRRAARACLPLALVGLLLAPALGQAMPRASADMPRWRSVALVGPNAGAAARVQVHQVDRLSPNASIFARGLIAPRGLKFGPDGFLYVAESGVGGTTKATGQQVPPPVGIGPVGHRVGADVGTDEEACSRACRGTRRAVATCGASMPPSLCHLADAWRHALCYCSS
jgi:hypothetical protein